MIDIEKRRARGLKWWRKHRSGDLWKEIHREYQHLLLLAFPEEMRANRRRRYRNNPNPTLNWRRRDRDKCNAASKRWRARNPEAYREQQRRRRKSNLDAVKRYSNAYRKRRRATDIDYRIRCYISARLSACVKNGRNSVSAAKLLGCSISDLRIYLESKFEPGMSWENYGKGHDKWHIDHIMPCAIFDLTKAEHRRRCFHFSNLQPLWEPDNLRKRAKVLTNQFALL